MRMKQGVKIILALVIGFAVAMLLMMVAIFFGYTNAYDTGVETFVVRLAGIPIYKLAKNGSDYASESQGVYMGFVCGICMALGVATEQTLLTSKSVKLTIPEQAIRRLRGTYSLFVRTLLLHRSNIMPAR